MSRYDYIIIGSGLFGSVFAHEAKKKGKRVKIIERRKHIGGNVYTESIESINVHKYGAHIFHTNNEEIWKYVNELVPFNNFINSPIAISKEEVFNLPFNMNTFSKMWGVNSPVEAKDIIDRQIKTANIRHPKNLEEQAISLVGIDIYERLIKGYTEKQWGRKAKDLPSFIIKRLPVRFTYDNNYFKDKYQGIPIGGYTSLIKSLIEGIEVHLNTDYFDNKELFDKQADKIIYTGPIDRFYKYRYGKLSYRSLRFDHEIMDIENFQGNAVVNYTDYDIPFTRILEHKHFEFGNQPSTVITKEFPQEWSKNLEPYYPINDELNNGIFRKYRDLAKFDSKVIFGGRLADYKYYDMHQVIASALKKCKEELEGSEK